MIRNGNLPGLRDIPIGRSRASAAATCCRSSCPTTPTDPCAMGGTAERRGQARDGDLRGRTHHSDQRHIPALPPPARRRPTATLHSAASPGPGPPATPTRAPTSHDEPTKACPSAKSCAASSATSPLSSTATYPSKCWVDGPGSNTELSGGPRAGLMSPRGACRAGYPRSSSAGSSSDGPRPRLTRRPQPRDVGSR